MTSTEQGDGGGDGSGLWKMEADERGEELFISLCFTPVFGFLYLDSKYRGEA